MDRRTFTQKLSQGLVGFAFLETFIGHDLFAKKINPITNQWAEELNTICQDLKTQEISQVLWQQRVEALLQRISLTDLMKFIDFERVVRTMKYPDLGVTAKMVHFPRLAGVPTRTTFAKKIFGMQKGRAIIPHGHQNMASAHLILRGDFEVKHYDKISENTNEMIIKPTIHKVGKAGEATSISDEKDNVHWYQALTDKAYTFDVIVFNLDPTQGKSYDISNIDPDEGKNIGKGRIQVPKLTVAQGLKKYGKSHH